MPRTISCTPQLSHRCQQGRSSPPGGPGTHPGPSGRTPTPPSPTPRRTGPTLDGTLDPGTPTPNPRSTRGLYPPSRSTDHMWPARGPQHASHICGPSTKKHWRSTAEAAPRPPDDEDPPAVTPMSPSPRTSPSPRLRARPLRHYPGPHDSGPPLQHPNPTKPLATGPPPPPTTTTRHPGLLGLPPGGGPRLNSPHRPRAQEDAL